MKRLVLLNPRSRNGRAQRDFQALEQRLRHEWGAFEVYTTTAPGDMTREVKRVLEQGGVDQILVAGGDGSIHEALLGYWQDGRVTSEAVPLGIIHLGTGGDLYRTVCGTCEDYQGALRENRYRWVDLGTVESDGAVRPYLNISSAGLAGAMLQRLKKSRFQSGSLAYFYHTLRTLWSYRAAPVSVEWLDAETGQGQSLELPLFNLFACNGKSSGGGMIWAPRARLDDGKLQFTLVGGENATKNSLVLHSGKVYQGRLDAYPGTISVSATSLTLRSERGLSLEADGEVIIRDDQAMHRRVKFEVVPAVFPLIL